MKQIVEKDLKLRWSVSKQEIQAAAPVEDEEQSSFRTDANSLST